MLLLVKETKSFIKEKKEEVLLVYFIVEIGLKRHQSSSYRSTLGLE